MKYLLPFVLLLMMCTSQSTQETNDAAIISYPESIKAVFQAHGGLQKWNKQKTLSYKLGKEADAEYQIIDVRDRRERIEGSNFTMGYDGNNTWVTADTSYKSNPVFYKNLMFYFYAMPFVLADPGITYSPTEDLVFEGKSYPGLRISYGDGIGESPEDEYFIHWDPETNKMQWLGYTVTYFSGQKSASVKWIKYDDWQDIQGLKLPASMEWYKNENNLPTSPSKRRYFAEVKLEKTEAPQGTFEKPADAEVVK